MSTKISVIELRAFVDTELWSLAKKRPVRSRFKSEEEFNLAMEVHERAVKFFKEVFPSLDVYISHHQLMEIFHVMAFRGLRVPLREALAIVERIMEDESIVKVPITADVVREALKESSETRIHVWDFLCFLPVRRFVDIAYSSDPHFRIIGERYGVEVVNPVGRWMGP